MALCNDVHDLATADFNWTTKKSRAVKCSLSALHVRLSMRRIMCQGNGLSNAPSLLDCNKEMSASAAFYWTVEQSAASRSRADISHEFDCESPRAKPYLDGRNKEASTQASAIAEHIKSYFLIILNGIHVCRYVAPLKVGWRAPFSQSLFLRSTGTSRTRVA